MKRNLLTACLMVTLGLFLISCAGKTVQKTAPTFAPYKFSADQYVPKVTSFLVVMDNSTSMTAKCGTETKLEISKDLLAAFNETLPELNFRAGLITFGPKNTINVDYKPSQYSTSAYGAAIDAVKNPSGGSNIPLATAFTATAADNDIPSQGKIAVIVISDGELMDKTPVNAAVALKKEFGDRLCIYTILLGDDPAGTKFMAQLPKAGACGFATTAADLAAPGKMAAFVEGIFLAKAPPKPAPSPVAVAPADSDGDGVIDSQDECPNTPKGAVVDARGCWTYEATVLFDFDSAIIISEDVPMLNEAVVILNNNPALRVEVDGYTDITGPEDYNQALSEKRANAVMHYFIERGIAAKRLVAKGFGFNNPAASNSTKEGRAKNRRVELKPIK